MITVCFSLFRLNISFVDITVDPNLHRKKYTPLTSACCVRSRFSF